MVKKKQQMDAEGHSSENPHFQVENLDKITTALLAETEQITSDKDLRQVFSKYNLKYKLTNTNLPHPQSSEYLAMVISLYERIARQKYNPRITELSYLKVADALINSYPYCTRSPETTALNLMMIAKTVRLCRGLPDQAAILEMGPGWGELTISLARLGFKVTAIDIDEKFIELILRKAEMFKLKNITFIHNDFLSVKHLKDQFDAIIFFHSFHHEPFHRNLLKNCVPRLKPNGKIIFSGEPITADNELPWGIRLDGQSLWSIAKNGWMELGFRTEYFEEMLHDLGLVFIKHPVHETSQIIYVATRTLRLDFSNTHFNSIIGKPSGTGMESTGQSGILVYGPYMHLSRGSYKLKCFFSYQMNPSLNDQVHLHIWHEEGKNCLLTKQLIHLTSDVLDFELANDVSDLEFVIEVTAESKFTFHHFELCLNSSEAG